MPPQSSQPEAATRPEPSRCLLVSDEVMAGYSDRYHWSHPDLPSFLSYDAVIIKAPPGLDVCRSLAADLRQAELAGIPVVWLISASSPIDVLKEISGGEVLPMRQGVTYEH